MTEQEILFLFTVRDTCKANPEMVAKIVDAANSGLRDRFDEMRELAANIEALACFAPVWSIFPPLQKPPRMTRGGHR